MSLTPINFATDVEQDTQTEQTVLTAKPSRTWRIDLENGRIRSFIDDKEAIRQYIRKALMTARNRYLIYDDYYGEEITDLIGQDLTQSLVQIEIPRLVREAIQYDDRIASIPSIDVQRQGSDGILITVTVEIVDGELLTEEVTF